MLAAFVVVLRSLALEARADLALGRAVVLTVYTRFAYAR